MIRRKFTLVLFLFSMSACMASRVVINYQARNDLVLKDSWKNFLVRNPYPKVVLRVPDSPKEITQSEMMSYNSLYNYIEKSLLEANFTVRDRSLLKEVLSRAGGELKYADIGKKIDTDVIVEIVGVKFGTWMQGTISSGNPKASRDKFGRIYGSGSWNEDPNDKHTPGPNPYSEDALAADAQLRPRINSPVSPEGSRSKNEVFGAIIEGRIIMVATGDVVGMFAFKEIHPYPEEWFRTGVDKQPIKISSNDLNESDIEYLRTVITNKLINFLKGQPVSDSIVTSSASGAASGWMRRS